MADRTTQPADGIGINPLYSGAIFLWNGAAPTKNQIGGATATLTGTTVSGGADGQYQLFDGSSPMQWSLTTPSGAYTAVLGIVCPAGISFSNVFNIGSACRVSIQRTGGGFYVQTTHTGVASASSYVISTSAPDTQVWTLVLRYTGTVLYQYLLNGSGTAEATLNDTMGFAGAQSSIGLGNDAPTSGLYMAMLVPSDVGVTEAVALRDNLWRAFAPEAGGGGTPSLVVSDGSHAHAADNLALTIIGTLSVADATHTHAADSITLTATSNGTITIPAIRDWGTKALKTGQTGVQVDIRNITTGALVVRKTGQATHATTGVCVVTDAAIVAGTTYEVVTRFADGSRGMWDYTAS